MIVWLLVDSKHGMAGEVKPLPQAIADALIAQGSAIPAWHWERETKPAQPSEYK